MKSAVVIPTFNEAKNIIPLIRSIREHVPSAAIIIVDDNSPDGTAASVRKMKNMDSLYLHIRKKDRGFAASILEGLRIALKMDTDFTVTMDADFSHDPSAIPELLEAMKKYDLVVGSRYIGGIRVLNWQMERLFLSVFANRYVRLFLKLPINDCTSGFRCYSRAVIEQVIMRKAFRSNGYAFLVETLYFIYRNNFTVGEVPIIFSERREGQSKMSKKVMLEAALLPFSLFFRRK